MTTPRIAKTVVDHIAELLVAAGAERGELDTLVADAVSNLRRAASVAKMATGTAAEQELVRALVHAKTLVLAGCPTAYDGWDFEEWSALLWEVFVAAVSNTKVGQSNILRRVQEDEALWASTVKAVLEDTFDIKTVVTGPWQATRRWLAIWMWAAGALCTLAAYLAEDISGRTKFYLAIGASCGFTLGEAWRRRGHEQLFSRTEITHEPTSPAVSVLYPEERAAEDASVSSASAILAAENEALKKKMLELEKLASAEPTCAPPLPPPRHPPPGLQPGQGGGHGQIDALRNFALGTSSQGPVTQSGAAAERGAQSSAGRCLKCQAVMDGNQHFCGSCGHSIQMPVFKLAEAVRLQPSDKIGQKFKIIEVGDRVIITGYKEYNEYNGLKGIVKEATDCGRFHVQLGDGSELLYVKTTNLEEAPPVHVQGGNDSYIPFTTPVKNLQEQAKTIRSALITWSVSKNLNWPAEFWNSVSAFENNGGLNPAIRNTLIMHGYKGAGTQVPPRTLTLSKELLALENISALQPGTASELFDGMQAKADNLVADNASNWHSKLPSDLNRAAPEIYRSMRASGAASVRDFISQLFPQDQRSSQVFTDLFTAASGVDFTLAKQKTEEDILATLSSDDLIEMSLRRIAAYLHQKRTGDTSSANHMLAVKPPGLMTDVAPTWLVTEASAHSKQEYQQQERGRKGGGKQQQYSGGGGGGGGNPGGGRGGGRDAQPKGKAKARKGDAKGDAKGAAGIQG